MSGVDRCCSPGKGSFWGSSKAHQASRQTKNWTPAPKHPAMTYQTFQHAVGQFAVQEEDHGGSCIGVGSAAWSTCGLGGDTLQTRHPLRKGIKCVAIRRSKQLLLGFYNSAGRESQRAWAVKQHIYEAGALFFHKQRSQACASNVLSYIPLRLICLLWTHFWSDLCKPGFLVRLSWNLCDNIVLFYRPLRHCSECHDPQDKIEYASHQVRNKHHTNQTKHLKKCDSASLKLCKAQKAPFPCPWQWCYTECFHFSCEKRKGEKVLLAYSHYRCFEERVFCLEQVY